jgi:hypothetical protein
MVNFKINSREVVKMHFVKHNFVIAISILTNPVKTLEEIKSEKILHALAYIIMVGAVTAFLTPLQIYFGFEDVNGLHAGGQAEFLARDISTMYKLGIEWRPLFIESFYVFILLFSTGYLHIILKVIGGKGSIKDTFKMIAYGDAPGLLFGWIPFFATVSAVWAAVIQLFIGPVVLHKLSWTRATIIFSVLTGLGIIEIAMS